jgi:small subunit ribosomal protein S3Ae
MVGVGMSSRKAHGKVKTKTWYNTYAFDIFPGQWIGETPANDPESLIGRNVEVVVRDITGDFMHEKYKLWFKIFKVEGNKAYARFVKEMLNKDYMRSIVQRRSSRVDIQSEGVTKDGNYVRIFTLIITSTRIRSSQKHAIRERVDKYIREIIPNYTVEEIVRSFIFGNPLPVTSEIQRISLKIAPIKYVELRKMVLLKPSEIREAEERVESSIASGG